MSERTALYRWYDADGVLLYVGISVDVVRRAGQHEISKPWWVEVASATVRHFDSRDEALVAEAEAIKAERPVYNVHHNGINRLLSVDEHNAATQARAAVRRSIADFKEATTTRPQDAHLILFRAESRQEASRRWRDKTRSAMMLTLEDADRQGWLRRSDLEEARLALEYEERAYAAWVYEWLAGSFLEENA